jgi:hypothetical protein
MTSSKKPRGYAIGYGKPPLHTRCAKGHSGNPGGRPRRTSVERVKALALEEAYRTATVKEGGRAVTLPAIQVILRRQVALAAKGNGPAQRAVIRRSRRSKRSAPGRRTLGAGNSRPTYWYVTRSVAPAARKGANPVGFL